MSVPNPVPQVTSESTFSGSKKAPSVHPITETLTKLHDKVSNILDNSGPVQLLPCDTPDLSTLTTINASYKLKTLFGCKWERVSRSFTRSNRNLAYRNTSLKRSCIADNMAMYRCVQQPCTASFECSTKVRRIGVSQSTRRFKLIAPHSCPEIKGSLSIENPAFQWNF